MANLPAPVSSSSEGCQILLSIGERAGGETAGLVAGLAGGVGARLVAGLVGVEGTGLITDLEVIGGGTARLMTALACCWGTGLEAVLTVGEEWGAARGAGVA